jgi:plastocyanin
MRASVFLLIIVLLIATAVATPAGTGTIKGHVKLSGKLPGNSVIRMGVDPKCRDAAGGKQVLQEAVLATADGSLANVFVRLQGNFPSTPVPTTPVTIDQRGCVYFPRVAGVRVGQPLQIKNSDTLSHNVHSSSQQSSNEFNVNQGRVGLANTFTLKQEDVMLHLRCDIHSWMTAYIGVVNNPYFAVSQTDGSFEIGKVPEGTYTIQAWHERYGPVSKSVKVTAGGTTSVEFVYTGNEKPSKD